MNFALQWPGAFCVVRERLISRIRGTTQKHRDQRKYTNLMAALSKMHAVIIQAFASAIMQFSKSK